MVLEILQKSTKYPKVPRDRRTQFMHKNNVEGTLAHSRIIKTFVKLCLSN